MTPHSNKLIPLLTAAVLLLSTFHAAQAQDAPTCEGFNERWSALINTSRAECDLGAIESIATQEDYANFCETCDTYAKFHLLHADWIFWAEGVEAPCTAEHPSTGEQKPVRELLRHFRHNLTGICLQVSDEYCHPELAELKEFMFDAIETFADNHEMKPNRSEWSDDGRNGHARQNRSIIGHEIERPHDMEEFTRRNRSGEDLQELVSDRLSELNSSSFNLTLERERVCASPCTRVAAAFARFVKAKIDDARRGPGGRTEEGGRGEKPKDGERGERGQGEMEGHMGGEQSEKGEKGEMQGERGDRMQGENGERVPGGQNKERVPVGDAEDRGQEMTEERMGGDSEGGDRPSADGQRGPKGKDAEMEGMFEDQELLKVVQFTNAYCNSNATDIQALLALPQGGMDHHDEAERGGAGRNRVLRIGFFLGFGSEEFTAERQLAVRWAIASGVLRDRELDVELVAITSIEEEEVDARRRLAQANGRGKRIRLGVEVEMPEGTSRDDINQAADVNAKANEELANLGMSELEVAVTDIDATGIEETSDNQASDLSTTADAEADAEADADADADSIPDEEEDDENKDTGVKWVVIGACAGGALVLAGVVLVVVRGRAAGQSVQAAKPLASAPDAAKEDLVYGLQLSAAPVGVPTAAPPLSTVTALEAVQSKV